MKSRILIITVGLCSCFFVPSKLLAQGGYDIAPLNALVDVLLPKKIHEKPDSLTKFDLLNADADYLAIVAKCKTDWSDIIDNRASINGADGGKSVVFWAMQELTASDYMSLIEKVTTLYEAGNFAEVYMKMIIFPQDRLRAFAADNFQHTRIIAVVNRLKAKTGDATFTVNLNDVLSGAAKTAVDDFRGGHAGLARGNIPEVILPN